MISAVSAPLFYLVPIGVGVLGLWRFRHSPWSAWLPITFLFGAVVTTRMFEAAERARVLEPYYGVLVAAVAAASLLGLAMLSAVATRVKLRWTAVWLAAIVAVPAYAYCYFWVSAFPFTDLFQDVHPMKLAEEFARTRVLNGLDSGSYIPVKPVLNGMLISLFGYDQLAGVWALAPWTAVFRLLVAWQASRLGRPCDNRMLAFVLIAGLLFAFDVTNGMLCVFGAIVLLVLLVEFGEMFERRTVGALIALVLPIAAYLFWRLLNPFPLLGGVMLIVVAVVAAMIARKQGPAGAMWLAASLVIILAGCLVPLHRGSMLFMPIVALASAAWVLRDRRWLLVAAIPIGAVALPAALGIAAVVMGASLLHVALPFSIEERLLSIVGRLIGYGGAEMLLGLGVKNALIEWVQAVGPMIVLVIGVVLLWSIVTVSGRTLWRAPLFVVPWALAAGLTCVILTGFPFAYRAMPFVCVFFAIALSVALPRLWVYLKKPRGVAVAAPLMLGLVYALAMAIPPLAAYVAFSLPLLFYSVVVAAIACGLLYWLPVPRAAALVAVLAALLSIDRASERVALFPHAYGAPRGATVISHYGSAELDVATRLRDLPPTTLVVSDPFTLSIIRARSGLNAPVSYSNLDTLNETSERLLRAALVAVTKGDRPEFCRALSKMLIDSREYRLLLKRLRGPQEHLDVVVLYSSRTRAWQQLQPGRRGSYFPTSEKLDEGTALAIERLAPGSTVEGGEIAIAHFRCEVGQAVSH